MNSLLNILLIFHGLSGGSKKKCILVGKFTYHTLIVKAGKLS